METRGTLRNFVAWQKAVTLHADVLRLSLTPAIARHPWLAECLRGSAQAIAGHLAEGHCRTDDFGKEVLYPMAKGICGQLLSQVLAARMAGLIENGPAEAIERQSEEVQRLVAGVLRARRENGADSVNGDRARAPRRPASDEGSRGGDPWGSRS